MSELIRLERVEIGYLRPLLPPLTLSVRRGEHLAVLGPNGGGKSTLLRTLAGLIRPLSGHRLFPNGPARIGYVPQVHKFDAVYPLTAFDVTIQGRYARVGVGRLLRPDDQRRARELLERVGLADVRDTLFRELSGGQRQRVLLARALCGDPDVLVLDEFTSDLDPAASAALLSEVSRLVAHSQLSVVFVTHEIAAAALHSSHTALIDSRRGVFEHGPTAELLTAERLTRLYGQNIRLERHGDRAVVFVETGGSS